jgi:hypothetical protein
VIDGAAFSRRFLVLIAPERPGEQICEAARGVVAFHEDRKSVMFNAIEIILSTIAMLVVSILLYAEYESKVAAVTVARQARACCGGEDLSA